MLGFLALGNFLGGRLADRHLSGRVLFWILVAASIAVSIIAFSEGLVIPALAQGSALKLEAIASAVALFAIPSTVLGMVAPYCIRLKMHAISDSGSTVGSLYALSTLGSIIGTFAAGFWLMALLGSHAIVLWIAAVPAVLSLLFLAPIDPKRLAAASAAVIVLAAAVLFSRPALDSFDTQYERYMIRRGTDTRNGRPVIGVSPQLDYGSESTVYADNGEPFPVAYFDYFDLALRLSPQVHRTLLIGGGAFAYPRHQFALYPKSSTDVVEIDPKLVDVARTSFFLKDDPRQRIIIEDGRTYLDKATTSYDVILLDVFKSKGSVPYQLTTRESMKLCYDRLTSHGVLAMNLVAALDGPGDRFLWAEYVTLKSVFPHVEVFAVEQGSTDPSVVQNICIVAAKDSSVDLEAAVRRVAPDLAVRRVSPPKSRTQVPILTDDFAPVDQYLIDL